MRAARIVAASLLPLALLIGSLGPRAGAQPAEVQLDAEIERIRTLLETARDLLAKSEAAPSLSDSDPEKAQRLVDLERQVETLDALFAAVKARMDGLRPFGDLTRFEVLWEIVHAHEAGRLFRQPDARSRQIVQFAAGDLALLLATQPDPGWAMVFMNGMIGFSGQGSFTIGLPGSAP